MKKLNQEGARLNPGLACRLIKDPKTHEFEVRGKSFSLDVQTLLAHQVDGDRYPAPQDFEPQFPPRFAPRIGLMVLNVTYGCNLRCAYCFVRNYKEREGIPAMSLDVARKAIELTRRPGPLRIGFFGGEPLLVFDRVKEIMEMAEGVARERNTQVRPAVTTNGTLITEEVAEFLAEKRFSLIVSLDGPKDVHNAMRPMADGGDSYGATLRGLELLKGRRGLRGVTLRSTFTAAPGLDIVKRLEYLNKLCDRGLATHVSVEPASLTESGCMALPDGHDLAFTPANVGALREQYAKAAVWYRDRLRTGRRAKFHHFYKIIQRIWQRRPAPAECGAAMGYAATGPDGTVYACHREGSSAIGDVWTGIDEALRLGWVDNRLYAREGCSECWARWACGGGCRMCSLDKGLPIDEPDPVTCAIKKMWIEEGVWLMSELDEKELGRSVDSVGGCPCGKKGKEEGVGEGSTV